MSGSKNIDLFFLQSMIDKNEPGVKINSYEVSDDVKLYQIIKYVCINMLGLIELRYFTDSVGIETR